MLHRLFVVGDPEPGKGDGGRIPRTTRQNVFGPRITSRMEREDDYVEK